MMASLFAAAKIGDVDRVRTLLQQGKYPVNYSDGIGLTPLHYACQEGNLNVVRALVSEFKASVSLQNHNGLTPLHYACEKGHIDVTGALVSYKADLSLRSAVGRTPLQLAARNGHKDVVLALLRDYQCPVTDRDNDGWGVLHHACAGGSLKIVEALIDEHKADLSALNSKQETPLGVALNHQKFDVVFFLICKFSCDPNVKDLWRQTPLHFACKSGDIDLVQALINEHKANVNAYSWLVGTPLHVAFRAGKYEVLLSLMSAPSCNPYRTDQDGQTVLHLACKTGNIDLVSALLHTHKMDVNALNKHKETPLHVAIASNRHEVALALVKEHGCDTMANSWGKTPLHYACKSGDVDLVQALIHEHKADVNAYSKLVGTPLHVAFRAGKYELLLSLMSDPSCDLYLKDQDGQTVLHLACMTDNIDLVNDLLHQLDVNALNKHKETPLHVAIASNQHQVALALVKEHGCDTNVANSQGKTPLHYACECGDVNLIQALKLHNANVNAYSKLVGTPLHVASRAGEEVLLSLMSDPSCDPYVKDQDGQTVLHLVCKRGNIDLVNALLHTHKMDVNALNKHKETPLHVALASNQHKVALALIEEHGCDTNVANSQGKTPLHCACECGNVDVVQALMHMHKANELVAGTPLIHAAFEARSYEVLLSLMSDPSCDPDVKDQDGQTVLHLACKTGNIDLVNALLHAHKMDVNALDRNGWTVLHAACKKGAIDLVHTLIHCMTDINVRTDKNDTPLHMAAWGGHYDVVLALVSDARCDPSARGYLERTALHVAAYWGHYKVVQELLKYASPLVVDKFGNTPLHLASQDSHVSTVQCLLHDAAPVLVRNAKNFTPRDLAWGECGRIIEEYIHVHGKEFKSHYSTILKLAEKKYSGSHWMTRIFVVGNPGAGKSSLIESLKREGFFESFSKVSESTVPPHTTGIIPSVHMSSQYGRVLFYDFAGDLEYYSSHAAIFESLASSRKGDNIFIIVVDLRENSVTLDTTLHYWFSFIRYQQFKEKPSLIVVGGHLDQSVDKSESLEEFCTTIQPHVHNINIFTLDCRDPRSNQIAQFKRLVFEWVKESQKYELSNEARLLLGLLEKDFSAVTACPVQTLVSHIKDSGGWLPVEPKPLHQILLELHEVGILLLLGDCTKDTDHVILNISKLTSEVHELLFSKPALSSIKKNEVRLISAPHCNVGILPEAALVKILPQHITKECLVHLQYCQPINHSDIGFFPSFAQEDATSQSFLFFPALCSADKGKVSWDESTSNSFSIGWLALCTDLHDYFPPRFLHVLLLRLVHRFTLSVPAQLQTAHASPEHSRRCTMWRKGVYWKMEEGVHCMVELVNGSKGVVVLTKSSMDWAQDCVQVFSDVVSCVMEAKIEFCDSAKPEFYLLDSGGDGNYLNSDYLFSVSDVKRALENPQGIRVILSVSGDREMKLSKLQALRKLTYWNHLFPITGHEVLLILEKVGVKIFELGLSLGATWAFLESLRADFPSDISQRRIGLVSWWMSSSTPPCWYTLVEALIDIEMKVLADKVREKHSLHIRLQEKMLSKRTPVKKTEQTLSRETETDETEKILSRETEAVETEKTPSRETEVKKTASRETEANKPDEEFLHTFSSVVGSRWPSLAVSLALTEEEIEELKGKVWLSQQELALQMLKIWGSKEEATYGQLCRKLKTITLFHYSS